MSNDCVDNNQPALRVVRGAPTAAELAALVGVVLARARTRPAGVSGPSQWVRGSRPGIPAAGGSTGRGPDAWRASALPR